MFRPFLSDGASRHVDGGTDYEFKIKQAIITPLTRGLASQLNAAPRDSCGRKGDWRKGVAQDVTPTGGCRGMGLKIPLLEHDLLKMETTRKTGSEMLLYLGQTSTDAPKERQKQQQPRGQRKRHRPTSYQPPLVQCHVDPGYHIATDDLFPMVTAMLTSERSAAATSYSSAFGMSCLLSIALLTVLRKFNSCL